MTPYKDDRLLALQKEDGDEEATIRIYDPEEDDFERFARFEVGSEAVLSGLAYDEAEDAVYVSIDHEVHAIEEDADEPGEALADLPIQDPDTIYPALILNNGSYVYCGRSAAVMDLSGKSGERTSLTISDANNNGVLDMVLQPFQSSHSNVRVRVDRNQDKIDNLVENLINQDDSIDIYLLDATMPVYEGLRSRGFMAPLEGSAAISELVNAMYPNVKDALTADGHIVALPLDLESPCLGISSKALGLVGLTPDDVPNTWPELLDFLPTLTDKLQDNDKVRLTYDFETVASVRSRFFNIMFATYQEYMNRTDPDMGYDTDLLRGLLQKLDAIDFEALGCLPEEDDEAELSDADDGAPPAGPERRHPRRHGAEAHRGLHQSLHQEQGQRHRLHGDPGQEPAQPRALQPDPHPQRARARCRRGGRPARIRREPPEPVRPAGKGRGFQAHPHPGPDRRPGGAQGRGRGQFLGDLPESHRLVSSQRRQHDRRPRQLARHRVQKPHRPVLPRRGLRQRNAPAHRPEGPHDAHGRQLIPIKRASRSTERDAVFIPRKPSPLGKVARPQVVTKEVLPSPLGEGAPAGGG